MTDAAVQALSTGRTPVRQGHLFGPWLDFLLLGGGSVIACTLAALAFPKGLPGAQTAVLVTLLMGAINQPHFAHSYQIFYRNFRDKAFGGTYGRDLRRRYVFAGLIVPAVLVLFLAYAALNGDVRLLAYSANAMFFLVGWHYVKQGYGILIVDSVQKRLFFSERAKTLLRVNGYACWMVSWLAANHAMAKATNYLGIVWYTLPIPQVAYYAAIGITICTTLSVAVMLARRTREARRQLPWNGVVAYLTTLYLWVVFVHFNPLVLAIVPTFHSLQYLAVVWRYQINANATADGAQASPVLRRLGLTGLGPNLAAFVAAGVVLGFVGFMGAPRVLDALLPYDKRLFGPGLFLFAFYIFINIHHYFLDNVMWRRGNPDVQRLIFVRAPATGAP